MGRKFLVLSLLACLSPAIATTTFAQRAEAQTLPDSLACEGYPEPRVFLESQSWWVDAHHPYPGAQIHWGTCFPLMQAVSGHSLHFDVRLQLVGDPGAVSMRRVQVFNDGPDGRREVRMTANIATGDTNPTHCCRMYNTTRWPMIVHNGKSVSNYPSGNRIGAAGWYSGVGYTNVYIRPEDFPFTPVHGTWTPSVKFESTLGFVSVDPSFDAVPFDETKHEGHVLYEGSGGSTWRTLTIDTVTLKLCNGDHRLFLRTGRPIGAGEGYGVFVVRFKVENTPDACAS